MNQSQAQGESSAFPRRDSLFVRPAQRSPVDEFTPAKAISTPLAHTALVRLTVILAVLFGLSQFFALVFGSTGERIINVLGPLTILLGCLFTAYRLVRILPILIWTPMPWFLAASAAYFGIGPLAYTFGTEEMISNMDVLSPVIQGDLWRSNILNMVGLFVIMFSFLLFMSRDAMKGEANLERSAVAPVHQLRFAMIVFLTTGLAVKWLLIMPYEFGQLDFVLPGVVVMLEHFVQVGLLLLGYLSFQRGKSWASLFYVLLVFDSCVNVLRFGKESLLLGIVTAALGRYFGHRRMKNLVGWGLVVCLIYVFVTPLVTSARNEIARRTGNHFQASLGERVDVAALILRSNADDPIRDDGTELWWWQRLSYANAQTYVMHAYESGLPGDTLSAATYVFVPRILWPDKPLLTDAGVDFSELVFGHRFGSTGIGVFGESYWNGGWPAIVFVCFLIGALFALMSQLAVKLTRQGQWLLLPCALVGVRMGLRIDGWVVTDYLGPAISCLLYFLVVTLLTRRMQRS